jgi:hypothetical protein
MTTIIGVAVVTAWVAGCLGFCAAALFHASAQADRADDDLYAEMTTAIAVPDIQTNEERTPMTTQSEKKTAIVRASLLLL